MKTVNLLLLISVFLILSCSNNYIIKADNEKDVSYLNMLSQQDEAILSMLNKEQIIAKNIKITSDTTTWTNLKTLGTEHIKTPEIFNIRFVKRWRGAFEGLGIGLLSGASLGVIIGLGSGDDPPGWFSFTAVEKASILGISFGTIGGILGFSYGAIAGSEDIYYLVN